MGSQSCFVVGQYAGVVFALGVLSGKKGSKSRSVIFKIKRVVCATHQNIMRPFFRLIGQVGGFIVQVSTPAVLMQTGHIHFQLLVLAEPEIGVKTK